MACRRGQWTGGYPVLGYDVDRSERTPKLVINPEEATKVRRHINLNVSSLDDEDAQPRSLVDQ